jgi:quercetin dioxygenase-like cupin family protein
MSRYVGKKSIYRRGGSICVLLFEQSGPAIAIAAILNHTGGNMNYPYTPTTTAHTHHRLVRPRHIVFILLLSLGLCFKATTLLAQEKGIRTLMSKIMKDVSGKEGLLLTVDYPPGGSTPIHRHNAHAFVYVLEGSIVMQLKGGKEVTLKPGETFYEGPNDIHIVSRNASNTEPAKYVVFLVKENGAPVLIPVK